MKPAKAATNVDNEMTMTVHEMSAAKYESVAISTRHGRSIERQKRLRVLKREIMNSLK